MLNYKGKATAPMPTVAGKKTVGIPDAIAQIGNLPGVGPNAGEGGLGSLLAKIGGPAFLANPWVGLGLTLGGGLLDSFLGDNPYDKARKELIEARQQRMADLRRKARGQFTPAEQQQITNNPALEAITESVGQAGLEGSSVGQNVLADSALQAFQQEQALATAGLNELELSTYNMLSGMIADDPGFGSLLGDISNFAQYQHEKGQRDAAFEEALKTNEDLLKEFQLLIKQLG